MTNPFGNYPSKNIKKREVEAAKTPRGTTKEVLEWVGNDKDRAKEALEQEEADDKPRKTLVEALNGIIDD